MISADNHTDYQDFPALRGFSMRDIAISKNRAANPQNPCIFEIWTFRGESHQITVRKPAESMHSQSAWESLKRTKEILQFLHELAGGLHDGFYKSYENPPPLGYA